MLTDSTAINAADPVNECLLPHIGAVPSKRQEWSLTENIADFPWVVNGFESYTTTLKTLPDVFAWADSRAVLANVHVLDHSIGSRRVRSFFDFIAAYDTTLAASMRNCFEALSPEGRGRFMTAPETIYRLRELRRTPTKSIMALAGYLNAESTLHDPALAGNDQCWTALGDFYHPGAYSSQQAAVDRDLPAWVPEQPFRSPYLAGVIPIDFFSPNVPHAKEITVENDYLCYSPSEMSSVYWRLDDTLCRIMKVSEPAGRLVREFVKVIIPFKILSGSGSTSERCMPGLVLLQGLTNARPARIASELVHEAIHQFLYILEYQGQFVVKEPQERVMSLWTGRDLQLHSYFHACFVWYGLANFWKLAESSGVFERREIDAELTRCLSGFRGSNPVDALGKDAGLIRSDALRVARILQSRLRDLMGSEAAPQLARIGAR